MIDRLLNIALVGGEPLLYLLLGLSLVSIAVGIERYIVYRRNRIDLPDFSTKVINLLNEGNLRGALDEAKSHKAAEAQVIAEGLRNFISGEKVASELMDSMAMREQQRLDKRLALLGTIGSNAPFIGLLGTVLGIIRAFNDLAFSNGGGPSVVMGGIAEALVATAVGLMVAIPAVVLFNYFKNSQKSIMGNIAQLQKMLLAFISQNVSTHESTPKAA